MRRDLKVWLTEGECIFFKDVSMSWLDGDRLLFHTEGSGVSLPCGINTHEVLAWEFIQVPEAE